MHTTEHDILEAIQAQFSETQNPTSGGTKGDPVLLANTDSSGKKGDPQLAEYLDSGGKKGDPLFVEQVDSGGTKGDPELSISLTGITTPDIDMF